MARHTQAQSRFRARLEIYLHGLPANARHPPPPPDGGSDRRHSDGGTPMDCRLSPVHRGNGEASRTAERKPVSAVPEAQSVRMFGRRTTLRPRLRPALSYLGRSIEFTSPLPHAR
jgi:hypothetical protein